MPALSASAIKKKPIPGTSDQNEVPPPASSDHMNTDEDHIFGKVVERSAAADDEEVKRMKASYIRSKPT